MEEKNRYPFTATVRKIGGGSRYVLIPSYFFNEGMIKEGQDIKLYLEV